MTHGPTLYKGHPSTNTTARRGCSPCLETHRRRKPSPHWETVSRRTHAPCWRLRTLLSGGTTEQVSCSSEGSLITDGSPRRTRVCVQARRGPVVSQSLALTSASVAQHNVKTGEREF
ncbi:hypothetical protein SKAU_G00299940 [Synaphobranchus kaupii]|uniref:Uncharacterized protein n=1 Tax=Synaphobranchus kaupii TaxID=118154 RepID=A0A9Q1EVC9_SYNKA|nr:hypothetical protein SKAU_G00299940 [Synaphobranchus kaupii]